MVRSRQPFIINECAHGTGGACGAEYLNEGFEQLIRKKLGIFADEVLNPRTLTEALKNFENNIKCQFNPLSRECEEEFEVPCPGADDIPSIGLEGGYLRLTKYVCLADVTDQIGMKSTLFSLPFSQRLLNWCRDKFRRLVRSITLRLRYTNSFYSLLIIDNFSCWRPRIE